MPTPTQYVYLARIYLVRPDYTRYTQLRAFTSLSAAMGSCRRTYHDLGELQFYGAPVNDGDVMVVCHNGLDLGTITQVLLTDTPAPL